jgi:integrase
MGKVLTQRGVEAAKAQDKRYGKPDGLVPGLQLIVQPSGAKAYRLLARIHGKQRNITIGNAALLTLAQAREEARRQLTLIAGGGDPRAVKQAAAATAADTVEVVARRFIERHAKPKLRTWREIERRLEREILPHWGTRPLATIGKHDVVMLLDGIVDRGVPVTANRTLTVARKMFNWAIERDLLETSPFDRVKPPAQETPRDRVLDDAELVRIWHAAAVLGYPFGHFVQLLLLTGQRRQEVGSMRWSEFDPELTLWTLPRERTKNGVTHLIPVPGMMRDLLVGLPRLGEYVFTTRDNKPIAAFSVAKTNLDVEIAAANAGTPIPPWRFHDLRRSFATNLAKLGTQLPTVEKLLNHTSGSFAGVAGIYQRHDFAAEKRAALELWAQHIANIVAVRP